MPPRQVNLYTSSWRATGANVQVPQYEITVRVDWITQAGEARSETRTVRFPNVLQALPAAFVGERMKELLIDAARHELGVDT